MTTQEKLDKAVSLLYEIKSHGKSPGVMNFDDMTLRDTYVRIHEFLRQLATEQ